MKPFALLLSALILCTAFNSRAQMLKDESKWTFEAKKKTGNQYELIVHVKLPKPWHIYSFYPGFDGSLTPPSFTFDKSPKLTLNGKMAEKGKLISVVMIEGTPKVNMYSGTVDYVQQATITGAGTITGEYTYQICNDNMCLPPTTKKMTFTIK